MSPTEKDLGEVNRFLLRENLRLLAELKRLKDQVSEKVGKKSQTISEPPGTIHCDLHCV